MDKGCILRIFPDKLEGSKTSLILKDTKPDTSCPHAVPAAGEPTISMTALLELLKDADPEMKAKLRLALLT